MNLTQEVQTAINAQEEGELFTYKDLQVSVAEDMLLSKSLSAYFRRGIIKKLTKGIYYKPKKSRLQGLDLPPELATVTEKLKELQGANVWYLTGVNAYNSLLLTFQVSTNIEIATDKPRTPVTVGSTSVSFVKSRLPFVVENPKLAQMLDALQGIQSIPDSTPEKTCKRVSGLIRGLCQDERTQLLRYAFYYSERTKALLGLCLDTAGALKEAQEIKKSLNPRTPYSVGLEIQDFAPSLRWNIR